MKWFYRSLALALGLLLGTDCWKNPAERPEDPAAWETFDLVQFEYGTGRAYMPRADHVRDTRAPAAPDTLTPDIPDPTPRVLTAEEYLKKVWKPVRKLPVKGEKP